MTVLFAYIPPPSTSVPNGPLAKFLLHPNAVDHSETNSMWGAVEPVLQVAERLAPVVAVMAVATVIGVSLLRNRRSLLLHQNARMLEVSLPPQVDPHGATVFWTTLHDLLRPTWRRFIEGQPHLGFELAWSGPSMQIRLWVPKAVSLGLLERAIDATWPGAAVTEYPTAISPLPENSTVLGGELRLRGPEWFSIKVDHDIDPLRAVIGGVGELGDHQGAVVQTLARPVTGRRTARCLRAATALRSGRTPSRALRLLDIITPPGHRSAVSVADDPNRNADIRAMLTKAAALGWEVVVRYGVSDTRPDSRAVQGELKGRAHGVASAFALYCERNRFARRKLRKPAHVLNQRRLGKGDLLSVAELAAVAHLPTDTILPGVTRAGARSVAPASTLPSSGKVLGDAESGIRRPVAVAPNDGRYHFHVLGSTGSGKSTLLTNLVLQDVDAGRGAVVIDPKGDLIVDILDRLPRDVADRVVLIDPLETGKQATMNVLGGKDDDADLVVDNLIGIFSRIFGAYWGPRTDDVLRSACLTLMQLPPATLADVPRILSDDKFRGPYKAAIGEGSELKGFWDWYEAMSDAQQAQVIGPVMNKLRAFLLRPFVSDIVGATASSFSMEKVLDNGLLLVRIPKGIVGDETARLMGSFVVAKVWQAATARSKNGEGARLNASLYVDECQNFLNLPRSFDEMLAEARGYGLSLVLAHQHLGQLSRDLRDAISANARNKVFFTISPEDAHTLERHFKPELTDHDLSHLGGYQVALRAVVDGREQPACTITTRPPADAVDGRADAIRQCVREAAVKARSAIPPKKAASTGRKVGSTVGSRAGRSVGRSLGSPGTAEADIRKTAGGGPAGSAEQNPDFIDD